VYDQKLDGILRKPSDNSKLKSLLPDFRFTGLKQGLQSSVDWFIENYERARK
jgi:GDP-L-fucose synthase